MSNICTNQYGMTFDLDSHDKIIQENAIDEFISKFIKRTQLRQMTKAECINTMYVISDELKENKK